MQLKYYLRNKKKEKKVCGMNFYIILANLLKEKGHL